MPRHKKTPKQGSVYSPKFLSQQRKSQDGLKEELASAPLSVLVPKTVDEAVRSLPQRTAWLRRVITEAAQRELMGGES